jgi:hypothetical protein
MDVLHLKMVAKVEFVFSFAGDDGTYFWLFTVARMLPLSMRPPILRCHASHSPEEIVPMTRKNIDLIHLQRVGMMRYVIVVWMMSEQQVLFSSEDIEARERIELENNYDSVQEER